MSPLHTLGALAALFLHLRVVAAAGTPPPPSIVLDNGTFIGAATTTDTHSFLGIPFAQPPVGDLRFRLPVAVAPYTGPHTVTAIGPACPQQTAVVPVLSGVIQKVVGALFEDYYSSKYPSAEDCLTINIIKPANATADAKLPVVLWLFAGGFEFGTPARYDGVPIVQRSIAMGQPIIYVSINYRVSAFGFLGGKEVRAAGVGNLGLHDQRESLRWLQKYIPAFGGDPTKVTIWGESAGAISASLQMLANGGDAEGLFRGAYMQSGSPVPVGPIEGGQGDYDTLVSRAGCAGAADTLACLRTVPYEKLKAAQDASPFFLSYQSLHLSWVPREDGIFLVDNPQRLVQQGKVAPVPFVSGDCDDEGTIFSLSTLNITTDADFATYLRTIWLPPTARAGTVEALAAAYPGDVTQGSPFGTGVLQALGPQYKRLAAFQGDAVFHAPRRFFQQSLSGKQNQWGYLNKRDKAIPFVGSYHTSDVAIVFSGTPGSLTDNLINFVTNLDPNGPTVPTWPQYTKETPNLLTLESSLLGGDSTGVELDTFRGEAIEVLTEISLKYPI